MMDVTISKLIMYIESEISTKDLRVESLSSTCSESIMLVLDHLKGNDESLKTFATKVHKKNDECMRYHHQNPTEITQHNLNTLQLLCLGLEMSFIM